MNEDDSNAKNHHDAKDDDKPDEDTNNDLHNFLSAVGSLKE
jgi:hypothetical protein